MDAEAFFGSWGSSPRVRGKPGDSAGDLKAKWLIPARAGKTHTPWLRTGGGAAHPRACGENSADPAAAARDPGSSPRVRGKRPVSGRAHGERGLIPACAGKTPGPAIL